MNKRKIFALMVLIFGFIFALTLGSLEAMVFAGALLVFVVIKLFRGRVA